MNQPEHAVTNLFDPELSERELGRRGAELHRRITGDLERDAGVMSTGEYNAHERARQSLEREFKGHPYFTELREAERQERAQEGRQLAGEERQEQADRARRSPRGRARAAAGAGDRAAARAAGRISGRGSRAFEQTGLPGAGRSVGQNVMRAIGAGLGLAIVYLLVNEQGGGGRALGGALSGLSNAVRVFVAPVDPLGGSAALNAANTAASRQAIAAGNRAAAKTYKSDPFAGGLNMPRPTPHRRPTYKSDPFAGGLNMPRPTPAPRHPTRPRPRHHAVTVNTK